MNRTRLTATDIVAPPVAPDRLAEYRRFGYISDQTISASVVRAARQWGSRPAIIEGGHQLTYQELLEVVERAAAWLGGVGVGPGDVVCWQTPNWWEAHVLGLAVWHAGAVSCPIAPFYREHELRQVIEQVRPAAVVTAETFRGFAHAEAFDDLLGGAGLADVARVVLRGTRSGWSPFDAVVSHGSRQQSADVAADDPCLILFTSGTTSGAKAAAHSSRSLLAETRQLAGAWGLSWEDVAYMAAPLQHITGVLNAMTIPLQVGASAVLADRWEADVAVADIMRHRVTYSAGATVFLQELTDAARAARVHLPLRMFACGGAAVPRAVMERSEEQGIPAARVYGMTELPTVTVMNRAHPFDLRAETDGAIAPGCRSGSSGRMASRWPRAARANCWCADRSRCSATSILTPTGRPSTTRDGSPPGMSVSSTAPASSRSPGGSRTSSTAAARSSPPATSKTCSSSTRRCATQP
ncbi:AMP-binding enzyme family protein [Mycobacterium intracellulare 1956]|uniref:AMP-binding enzyme family protein n=1 Tax=Mycobacterium intracellulare 1956 TaxID=1299331 RepID=X8CPY1_MYCIT|nr:AMP-binding enzyme family protein [Mycobacterium intracellulare 1956]